MSKNFQKYIAEFIGTFALSLLVALSLSGTFPVAVPVMAALTLALFVYTIGGISGANINPAVTIGLLSIKKISWEDGLAYIFAQCLAGGVVMYLSKYLGFHAVDLAGSSAMIAIAEAVGMLFFTFGIASVVHEKVNKAVSGVVAGGSLLLGVVLASSLGSAGALNPAVEIAIGLFNPMYVFGSVLGSILGFQTYTWLISRE